MSRHVHSATMATVLVLGIMCSCPAWAVTDFFYFSVNGDTTISVVTQGEQILWVSNCDSGSTVRVEIWYDANVDSLVDPLSDAFLTVFNLTDGDLQSDQDGMLDGFVRSFAMTIVVHPGSYIFRGTDFADQTTVQGSVACVEMESPPNQLSGQITVPGHPVPDSQFLQNVLVWADVEGPRAYTAMTDENGAYTINVDTSGTGTLFRVFPGNIKGFATPMKQDVVASGVISNIDFAYAMPSDSVYGYLRNEVGAVLDIPATVEVNPIFLGVADKQDNTIGGRYIINYAVSELGAWQLELRNWELLPVYLVPATLQFSHDTLNSFRRDITLYSTDTVIFARVTENGGPATAPYLVKASSSPLAGWTVAVSGTGSDDLAVLRVSSWDPSNWVVTYDSDGDFPLPPGLIWDGIPATGVSPGDTVTLNLMSICPVVLTGDANVSGDIVASDIIYLVNYVLRGGPEPIPCAAAGDVNCSGTVVTSDIVYLVNYVFRAGPAPCDVCTMIPGTWTCP